MVDDAYWYFEFEQGDGELDRLETATLRIPYPWVAGEAHAIAIVSRNGTRFPVEIPVAVATPQADASQLGAYALLGVYVGILPIVLGLLWYPFLRTIGRRWMNFVLALTVGLLVFLAVDTLLEALEIAGDVPGIFQAGPLVYLITLLSFLSILAVGRASGRPQSRLFLSYMIALGIGFHNLGEGLAVGAAYALGQASLGAFLVISALTTAAPSPAPGESNNVPNSSGTLPTADRVEAALISDGLVSITLKAGEHVWARISLDGQTAFEGMLDPNTVKVWQAADQIIIETGNAAALIVVHQGRETVLGERGQIVARAWGHNGAVDVPLAVPEVMPQATVALTNTVQ
jgi:hypothetical protein